MCMCVYMKLYIYIYILFVFWLFFGGGVWHLQILGFDHEWHTFKKHTCINIYIIYIYIYIYMLECADICRSSHGNKKVTGFVLGFTANPNLGKQKPCPW